MEKINLYVAVEQMKRITISGVAFSHQDSGNGTVRRGTAATSVILTDRPFEEKGDG